MANIKTESSVSLPQTLVLSYVATFSVATRVRLLACRGMRWTVTEWEASFKSLGTLACNSRKRLGVSISVHTS